MRVALLKLKEINSKYAGISLREDAEDSYAETSATEEDNTENVDEETIDESAHNNEEECSASETPPDEQDDSVAQRYGIAFDSCLQPADVGQEILSFGDNIYSIAPAEGNRPVSFSRLLNWSSWHSQCNSAKEGTHLMS